MSRIAGLE